MVEAAKAHMRPGELLVAQISTRSPQRAMAEALGSAAADGGAGSALQVGAMGAAGVIGGEGLRRLLFGRRRRA